MIAFSLTSLVAYAGFLKIAGAVIGGAAATRAWFSKEIKAGKILLQHIEAAAKADYEKTVTEADAIGGTLITDAKKVETSVKSDASKIEADVKKI